MTVTPPSRRPLWLTALLVVLTLPLLATPALFARLTDEQGLYMGFPLYVILSVYLAYKVWPSRPYLTWILISLLVLSYLSLIYLLLCV